MPLLIPPAVNYPSPPTAFPAAWAQKPVEGAHIIPFEVDWATMGGANKCVSINLQNNATLNISRICALKFDNSACGADVQFIFPQFGDTVTAPAYGQAIVPIFTNSPTLFVYSPNANSGDVTRFSLHNEIPPPVDLSRSAFVEDSASGVASLLASGTTNIIAAGQSGTLEYLQIGVSGYSGGTAFGDTVTLADGDGNNVGMFVIAEPANASFSGIVWQSPPISIRFSNGLKMTQVITGGGASGSLYYNAYYRVP